VLLLFAACLEHPVNASDDFWVKRAPMPVASAYVGAVAVNGEIHVITPNSTYMYDPTIDTWTHETPPPTVRIGFAVATYQNIIYVFGGCSDFDQISGYPINCTGANQVYNPATGGWETRAPMPTARAELQANVVNGRIYLIGGTVPSGNVSNATEVYDPSSDSWSEAAPIPTAVGLYASAVVDNKIYVEGGGQSGPSIGDLNQIFNPETNIWTIGEPLPAPLAVWAAAGATSGVFAPSKLYVIGGTADGINGTQTNQIYDPQTNSWTTGASMLTARGALSVTVVNDTLYAIGGTDNFLNPQAGTSAENEQYFPLSYAGPNSSPSLSPSQSASPATTFPAEYITTIALAAIVIIVVAAAFIIRKRRSIFRNS
jgi:N-acetylneuraminic acid mutarotase